MNNNSDIGGSSDKKVSEIKETADNQSASGTPQSQAEQAVGHDDNMKRASELVGAPPKEEVESKETAATPRGSETSQKGHFGILLPRLLQNNTEISEEALPIIRDVLELMQYCQQTNRLQVGRPVDIEAQNSQRTTVAEPSHTDSTMTRWMSKSEIAKALSCDPRTLVTRLGAALCKGKNTRQWWCVDLARVSDDSNARQLSDYLGLNPKRPQRRTRTK
jgi:hypothetical protein